MLASLESAIRKALQKTPDLTPRTSGQVFDRTQFKTGFHQVANRLTSPLFGSSRKVLNGSMAAFVVSGQAS